MLLSESDTFVGRRYTTKIWLIHQAKTDAWSWHRNLSCPRWCVLVNMRNAHTNESRGRQRLSSALHWAYFTVDWLRVCEGGKLIGPMLLLGGRESTWRPYWRSIGINWLLMIARSVSNRSSCRDNIESFVCPACKHSRHCLFQSLATTVSLPLGPHFISTSMGRSNSPCPANGSIDSDVIAPALLGL